MRLLLGIDHWGLIGGSERHAAALAEALVERGHDVRALAGTASGAALADVPCEVLASYSAPRADLETLRRAARSAPYDVALLLSIRSTRAFETLLDLGRPVVRFVQDHTLFCPGLDKLHADGTRCSRPLGAECLARYHLGAGCTGFRPALHRAPWRDGVGGLWKHLRGVELARRARALIVASQYMRGELLRAGLDERRVAVLPYFTTAGARPIDDETLPRELRAWLAAERAPLVLTPSRLVLPDKGVDFLLSALTKVRGAFRALIAGSGPAEAWLREKAQAEGLGARVRFTGWLSSAALDALYARANVVACPSMWDEPFGLVGLEAAAHARPVVAFDVGGVREWLEHGVNGLLVPRGDTEAFARALDELLAEPGRAAALGRAGQDRLRTRFSRAAHVAALEALLERTCG